MRNGAVDCLVPDPGCARWTDRAPPTGRRRPRRRPRGVREPAIAVAPGHLRSDGSTWEGAVRFRRQGRHELLHPLWAPPQLRRRHLHDEGRDTRPDLEAAGQATAGERRARVARSARSPGQGLVDEDAGWDDVQAQPRPPAAAMHFVLALFSRHVQLRGERSGAAARVRRIRDVHSWPEEGRPLQHLRAIARYPVGAAALPPPGRPRGARRHRAGRSSRKPTDTERDAQRLSHQRRQLLSLRRRALERRHASPQEPRAVRPSPALGDRPAHRLRVLRIRTGVPSTRSSARPVLRRRAVSDGQRRPVPHLAPHSRDHEHADTRRR